jgi:hypothetical protein
MKDLVPFDNEKNDAFTRILRFVDKRDIILTAEEERILDRWIECDKMLRSRKYKTEGIIDALREKFGVSTFTAQNDIRDTYALFGQTRIINKEYVLSHHVESIQLYIERNQYDKSLAPLMPKLFAELTRATVALQDATTRKVLPAPVVIIGSLTINQNDEKRMTIEEAREKWKQRKQKRSKEDYTDFEDVQ